jgi:hypothetical protein
LPAHCKGKRLTFCAEEGSSYGINFGTRKVSVDCDAKDVCIDDHAGHAACVHAPATRCKDETPDGGDGTDGCDGNVVLACMSPSPSVSEYYVVSARPCSADTHCVAGKLGGSCEPNKK